MNLSPVIQEPERWAPVPGFERYEVSDLGRVRSVTTGRLRKPFERQGVPYQAVYLKAGEAQKCFLMHSLVLSVFRTARPDGMVGRHIDGDARNNRLTNLEWGTQQDNGRDQRRHGRTQAGERNNKAKLTAASVASIRESAKTNVALAREYGVRAETISNVRRGATWAST
jgi:hypothetical protein